MSAIECKRVLVSGFGPFGQQTSNLSEMILPFLEGLHSLDFSAILPRSASFGPFGELGDSQSKQPVEIHTVALPVSHEGVVIGAEYVTNVTWDAIILLGISDHAVGPTLEIRAANYSNFPYPDMGGRTIEDARINPDGPSHLRSNLHFDALRTCLSEQWVISSDAGTYLCNELYWHCLAAMEKSDSLVPVVFLHLPTNATCESAVAWVLELITCLSQRPRWVVGAALLRDNDGRILCASREEEIDGNRWELPGGKRELGEEIEETVRRELLEELGVSIDSIEPCGLVHGSMLDHDLELHVFAVNCISKPRASNVHTEICWLDVPRLLELKWLKADLPLIDALISQDRVH